MKQSEAGESMGSTSRTGTVGALRNSVAAAALGLLLFAAPAGAQHSKADILVGAGSFRTDDYSLATGEVGLNVWPIRRLGVGVRHSFQAGRTFDESVTARLLTVSVNLRQELTARSYLQVGWIPLLHSTVNDAFGAMPSWGGGFHPLFDVFVNAGTPWRRFRVQGGVNVFARERAWIHPMVLGVFSFP